MGIDPLSLGLEGAAIGEAGAKGAEGAGALAPVLGAGDAAAATATGAGAGSLDALAAGLTPSGASILAPDAISGALGAAAGGAAGGVGDVLAGGASAGQGGIGSDAAGSLAGGALPPNATPTIAAAASPAPTGGLSAGGLAGPSGGIDSLPSIGGGATGAQPLDISAPAAATPGASAASPASSGITGFLKSNPGLVASLGAGVAGTALSPMLSRLINKVPQQGNLDALAAKESSIASQQQQLSQTLTDPLTSGKLPAGAEQSVSTAINDAVSTTKARYANLGLSGSTMEADAIANIQNQATGLRFNIAQQMAQTGEAAIGQASSALGLQDQVYNQLMQAQISQDNNLQTAIARFAGAAAAGQGSGKSGVNLQFGGSNS